jgi:transglycosylase-like protein with SLT domain
MMRRLRTSTVLFAALSLVPPALAAEEADKLAEPPVQATVSDAKPSDTVTPSSDSQAQVHPLTRDEICQLIQSAAETESLPFEFFARLIWQESRFNPQAVSPAGAQGIAQFMPKTANGRGLADPFEPASALQESAEFLRELRQRFGNVGLAAAAYNAGPKRVQDWLAKRASLPRETQNYVQIITGHSAQHWVASTPPTAEEAEFQCNEIARMVAQRRGSVVLAELARLAAQRLSGEKAARSAARKGILAKRTAPALGVADKVQAAKAVKEPRGRIERIIRITAQGRGRPQVTVLNVAKAPRADNVKVAATPQRPDSKAVKVATLTARSKTTSVDRSPRKAAAQPRPAGKIRVAANNR